jgi:hypothetical protein
MVRRAHMSYVNATDVLPKILIEEIQRYVDGQLLYIPRKNENSLSWGEKNGEWTVIHRCKMCSFFSSNRVAADDNPMKLMSIAMKPISQPPFPVEKIEEMTRMMGGEGGLK